MNSRTCNNCINNPCDFLRAASTAYAGLVVWENAREFMLHKIGSGCGDWKGLAEASVSPDKLSEMPTLFRDPQAEARLKSHSDYTDREELLAMIKKSLAEPASLRSNDFSVADACEHGNNYGTCSKCRVYREQNETRR